MAKTMLDDLAFIERLRDFPYQEVQAMSLCELTGLFVDVSRRLRSVTSDEPGLNFDPALLRVSLMLSDRAPINVFGDALARDDTIGPYTECLARCHGCIDTEPFVGVGPSGDDFRLALEAQRWPCVIHVAEALHEVAPRIEADVRMNEPNSFGHPIVRLYVTRVCELASIREICCLAAAISGLNAKARALRGQPPLTGLE